MSSIKKLALRDDRMQIAECRRQIQKIMIRRWGDREIGSQKNFGIRIAECGVWNRKRSKRNIFFKLKMVWSIAS
jgi:hypothetical protein